MDDSFEYLIKNIQDNAKKINDQLGKIKITVDTDDKISNPVMMDEWIIPQEYKMVVFGDIAYKEPVEWWKKDAKPREGRYYYPYGISVKSQIWITRMEHAVVINNKTDEEELYRGFIEGVCENGHMFISSEDILIKSMYGKKYAIYMKLENGTYEVHLYCFVKGQYLYVFSFGEKGKVSNNLAEYEKEFLDGFEWR